MRFFNDASYVNQFTTHLRVRTEMRLLSTFVWVNNNEQCYYNEYCL